MKFLVTGCAGFIGFHLTKKLLSFGNNVYGVDNLNNYYSQKLKIDRLKILKKNNKFIFKKINIKNFNSLKQFTQNKKIDCIVHLAAQAGVRYSLLNPSAYTESNLLGFSNIVELSRRLNSGLIFASTSSVYGDNKKFPLKENFETNKPLQFYAATKKANEVIAYSYSYLFKIPCIGLRFFTVYGPWGRPDMSLFYFVKNILKKKTITIFNKGNHYRDFTYVDDIVDGILKSVKFLQKLKKSKNKPPFEIFNLGRGKSIDLKDFISEIEKILKIKAKKKYYNLQKGDIVKTHSSIVKSKKILGYNPKITYKNGIKKFINWYKNYY